MTLEELFLVLGDCEAISTVCKEPKVRFRIRKERGKWGSMTSRKPRFMRRWRYSGEKG